MHRAIRDACPDSRITITSGLTSGLGPSFDRPHGLKIVAHVSLSYYSVIS